MQYQRRTNLLLITGIVGFALLLRIFYMQVAGYPVIVPDSVGYQELAGNFLKTGIAVNFVSLYRMPLYPMLIAGASLLSHLFRLPDVVNGWGPEFTLMVVLQTITGLAGCLLAYSLSRSIGFTGKQSLLFCLFIASDIMLFSQERIVNTESLSIVFLLLVTCSFFITLRKPSILHLAGLTCLCITGFLLKPTYVALPVFLFPVIALYHRKKQVTMRVLAGLMCFIVIPVFYLVMNIHLHGYRGINSTSEINVLGRILSSGLSVEGGKPVRYFYDNITDYRAIREDTQMPYLFLNYYDPVIYGNVRRLNELQVFDRLVVYHEFPSYVWSVARDLPNALLDTPPEDVLHISEIKNPAAGKFFFVLYTVYRIAQYGTLILYLLVPVTLVQFFLRRTYRNAALAGIGIMCFYQIFLTVSFGYSEWGRLIIVAQPLYYVFTLYWILHGFALFSRFRHHTAVG